MIFEIISKFDVIRMILKNRNIDTCIIVHVVEEYMHIILMV